jgi:hypothetical protein
MESSDDVYLDDRVRRNQHSFEYFMPCQAGTVQLNDRLRVGFRIAKESDRRPVAGDGRTGGFPCRMQPSARFSDLAWPAHGESVWVRISDLLC